ncbi:hypothetical protein PPN31114_04369 [Pandoraea pneumonica]|jgi:hypothetical protein|uniref:Uncharacterized protein n=1 Tax=Pandoraea pneumonica TaxID=2508299 RepID=A0A5E4YA83_9BURK|nr:hypothetical protein [Pandoraea pneumonica]VVE45123.1 hypothetical protein PPN31114_04369 [Pandoraea pneumonica]
MANIDTSIATFTGKYGSRTLDAAHVDACVTAKSEKDVTSLWGRIKDYFLGTHKEEAKLALFQLAHAANAVEQFEAFWRLNQLVEPTHSDLLNWNLSVNEPCTFQVGEHIFPTTPDWSRFIQFGWSEMELDDTARLLGTLRFNGDNVLAQFHQFGVGELNDRNADTVLLAQTRFLAGQYELYLAMTLLGLGNNDADGNFAFDLNEMVTRRVFDATGDDDVAARAGRNAENLSILTSRLCNPV